MSFFRRRRGPPGAPPADPRAVYEELRSAVLQLDPASVGIQPSPELPDVWGVVMDWDLSKAVATFVSLADGTTSMYLSSGGGTIGAGGQPRPAAASINAVHIAQSMLDSFPPTQDLPLPASERIGLIVLTYAGPRRIEDAREAMEGHPLADAMQQVIHYIQVADQTSG